MTEEGNKVLYAKKILEESEKKARKLMEKVGAGQVPVSKFEEVNNEICLLLNKLPRALKTFKKIQA
jgi:hypothetical protein